MMYEEKFLRELQSRAAIRAREFYQCFCPTTGVDIKGTLYMRVNCYTCDKKNADFRILEGDKECLCPSCGRNLDPLDYLMANYNCSFDQSITIIAAFLGYSFPLPTVSSNSSSTCSKKTEETLLQGNEKEVFYKNWRYTEFGESYVNLDFYESFKVEGNAVQGHTCDGKTNYIKVLYNNAAAKKWLDEWMKSARSKPKAN